MTNVPIDEAATVSARQIGSEPLRKIMGDPPVAVIGGVEQRCVDCHRFLNSIPTTDRRRTQHTHIELDHGLNDRCLNCHHDSDRSKLVLHDGGVIGYDQVEHLCAKCHGPTYRDWQKGMHGKTLGYWDTSRGPQHRLKCTHCHDPHAPAFEPMAPLPGPRTLRMTPAPQQAPHHEDKVSNPLRTWSDRDHGTPTHEAPSPDNSHE